MWVVTDSANIFSTLGTFCFNKWYYFVTPGITLDTYGQQAPQQLWRPISDNRAKLVELSFPTFPFWCPLCSDFLVKWLFFMQKQCPPNNTTSKTFFIRFCYISVTHNLLLKFPAAQGARFSKNTYIAKPSTKHPMLAQNGSPRFSQF